MKEIIIVSDSHLNNSVVNNIFAYHPHIDTCIHCGDIQESADDLKVKNLHIVRGNNDFDNLPKSLTITIENKRFFIAHGHLHDVEYSLEAFTHSAKEVQADIACYGHTHDPKKIIDDNLLIINPGSCRFPRGGNVFVPTYAILSIDQDNIEVHFYHAKDHHNIDDLVAGKKKSKEKRNLFGFFRKK